MTTRPTTGTTLKRVCRECGGPLTIVGPRGQLPKFCAEPCRTAFNMRRRQRGAELYDLLMANQFERQAPARKNGQLRRAIGRLLSRFRDEDHRARNGRASWGDWREALERDPTLTTAWGGTRPPWTEGRTPPPTHAEITV